MSQNLTFARREFLRGAAGISVASTFPLFLGKTAAAVAAGEDESGAQRGRDRILVVVQLSGGNDGLSTVVPYAEPAYGKSRTTIRIGEDSVLKIDERVGLHPNLKELKELYDSGETAIVQGASYPNPTRSHFEAMDIWHTADRSGSRRGSGWLGRAVDSACGNRMNPLLAVNLGGSVPLALRGDRSKPIAFQNPGAFQWRGDKMEKDAFAELNARKPERPGEPVQSLDYLRRVAADAGASSDTIRKATQSYRGTADYPSGNRLAEDLRLIAAMIAAGLPTRIFYASIGGFDTHANQRATHDGLMKTLSTAVAAFVKDLRAQRLLDRVAIMTFSEFGRRVKENGSRGTDHGVAAPMFIVGGGVRGGLFGKHPDLERLDAGDLKLTTDFRRVYASVLDGWLGISSEKVLGEKWEPLPLFGARENVRAF
jgi:uncharacterized protein (DUF1501 family)